MTRRRSGIAAALLLGTRLALAAPGVTVSVTPERSSFAAGEDVVVTVTMTNTTNATHYLLAWQTPFAGAPTAPLLDVLRDGRPVPYLGIQAKRAAPTASDYIALAPGASRSAGIELSALYDLGAGGAYSVRWRAGTPLYGRPGALHPQSHAEPGAPALLRLAARPSRGLPPSTATLAGAGLTFSGCSAAQQESIAQAAQAARAMAADGAAYLDRNAPGARYTTWFGAVDPARAATVARNVRAIGDAFATKPVAVDCGCDESYYAYVYPNQPYKIHVCRAFWSAPLTGTDSRAGTLVHEMSHFTVVAGTDDRAYGQQAAAQLAAGNPERAVDNADSHEYFGENTPHLELRGE